MNFSESMQALKAKADEHTRRLEADPEYRREVEAEQAREKAEREVADRAWREKTARAEAEVRRAKAEIPRRVWPVLDAPRSTTAYEAALAFAKGGAETLLVLAGGVGCGKTVAACAALDRFLAPDPSRVSWDEGFAPLGAKKPTGSVVKAIELARAGTFDREFWDRLAAAGFLVIDDLGTEPLDEKGWVVANVRALIDKRYDDERKTILTTNLNLDQFKARYCADGGRLLERLRERGGFLELADASLRTPPPRHWTENADG